MKKLIVLLFILTLAQAFAEGPRIGDVESGSSRGNPDKQSDALSQQVKSVGDYFKHTTSGRRISSHSNLGKTVADSIPREKDLCEELNASTCDVLTTDPVDHLKFGISFISFRQKTEASAQGPKNCKCLSDKLQGNKTNDEFAEAIKKERASINEKILSSYGRKFVNQFAGNLEDMSFFLNQSSGMFSDRGKAIDLQCKEPSLFNEKVAETCGKKKITDQSFIQRRKDMFINAVNGANASFEYMMPALSDEVLSASKSKEFDNRNSNSEQNTESNSTRISRFQFDQMRMDLAVRDPEARFMDRLISGILNQPKFNVQLNELLNSAVISPIEALTKVIGENIESTNSFADIVSREEANKYLKDSGTLENAFAFFMMVHPGVGLALSDKKAFENVRKLVNPQSNETFLNTLNNKKNVLEPILTERCQTMIEEFAKAVCTQDEELITSVDTDDLQLLLQNDSQKGSLIPAERGTHLNELLLCEARVTRNLKTTSTTIAGLGEKIDGGSVRDSDYIASSGGKSGIALGGSVFNQFNFAAANSAAVRKEMAEMIDRNNQTRSGFSGPGIAVNKVYAEEVLKGKVTSIGSSPMSKDEAKKYIAESRMWEEKRSADIASSSSQKHAPVSQITSGDATDKSQQGPQSSQVSSQQQNFAAPQGTPMISPNYASAQTSNFNRQADESRELLRQYLAEKNDAVTSNKAVNALDDSSAQELSRLRSENQSLLEEQLKAGEARLKELRTELSNAASKVPPTLVDRKIASFDEEDFSETETISGRTPRSIDQRSPVNSVQASAGSVPSSAARAQSGASSSSVRNVSKEAEPETQTTVSSATRPESDSLVITTTEIKSSDKLQSPELNQEVQKYLVNSDLGSTSIEDIKTKGFKIRFSVIENNKLVQKEIVVSYANLDEATRNQIDFKLARKNVQNQVSKLSVLRMLIKQNQRL